MIKKVIIMEVQVYLYEKREKAQYYAIVAAGYQGN